MQTRPRSFVLRSYIYPDLVLSKIGSKEYNFAAHLDPPRKTNLAEQD